MGEMVTVTQLDLHLGLVRLTADQRRILEEAAVPVLAKAALRTAEAAVLERIAAHGLTRLIGTGEKRLFKS